MKLVVAGCSFSDYMEKNSYTIRDEAKEKTATE